MQDFWEDCWTKIMAFQKFHNAPANQFFAIDRVCASAEDDLQAIWDDQKYPQDYTSSIFSASLGWTVDSIRQWMKQSQTSPTQENQNAKQIWLPLVPVPYPRKFYSASNQLQQRVWSGKKREPSSNHTSPQMRHSRLGEVQTGSIRLFAGAQWSVATEQHFLRNSELLENNAWPRDLRLAWLALKHVIVKKQPVSADLWRGNASWVPHRNIERFRSIDSCDVNGIFHRFNNFLFSNFFAHKWGLAWI